MDCSPIVLAHEPPFRIGDAEFRPATREVRYAGGEAVLEPRVMQLLIALRRAGGNVVTKDELARSCWDGRVVGEDAINRVVSRLRAVASKTVGGEFAIQTITKVGYRLVPANGSASPQAIADRPTALPLDRRQLVIGGATVAASMLAVGVFVREKMRADGLPKEARLLVADARSAFKTDDADELANAVGQLRRAAELAPQSALVWGLLALGYMKLLGSAPVSAQPGLRMRGLAAAKRSLSIDSDQPDARAAMIHALQRFGNWYDYENACRRALRNHPEHLELNVLLAGLLAQVGRFSEIIPLAEHCMAEAPLQPRVYVHYAMTLNELGRVEEAEALFNRAWQLWPRKIGVWVSRFHFLLFNHRPDEALAMVNNVAFRPTILDDGAARRLRLQAETVTAGNRARIRTLLSEMEAEVAKGMDYPEDAAMFAAYAGEIDAAFRIVGMIFNALTVAAPQGLGSAERHTYFLFWRAFGGAQRDRRFGNIVRSLGLATYWERSGTLAKVSGAPIIASALRSAG